MKLPSYKFRDPEALLVAAQDVAEIAREGHVSVALTGGLVMQMYGSDRLTGDVDFLADGTIPRLPLLGKLTFGGVRSRAPNGVPVDLIIRIDDYAALYEAALRKARLDRTLGLRVVTPEYLAAMKLAAGRPAKDVPDLEHLITVEAFNLDATRKIIRKFLGVYAVADFNEVLEEVAWKTKRGNKP